MPEVWPGDCLQVNFPDEIPPDEVEMRRMEWELMGYVTAMAKDTFKDPRGNSSVVTLLGVGELGDAEPWNKNKKPTWIRAWKQEGFESVWTSCSPYGLSYRLNQDLRVRNDNKPVKVCK